MATTITPQTDYPKIYLLLISNQVLSALIFGVNVRNIDSFRRYKTDIERCVGRSFIQHIKHIKKISQRTVQLLLVEGALRTSHQYPSTIRLCELLSRLAPSLTAAVEPLAPAWSESWQEIDTVSNMLQSKSESSHNIYHILNYRINDVFTLPFKFG
jgi:hypothetical protein